MRFGGWTIGLLAPAFALALAGCGAEVPPEQAADPVETSEAAPDIAVSGPERTILAFGDSLFAGYDLAEHEGYPERLEVALRAQGINARVIDAGVSGDTTAAGRQRIGFVLDNAATPPDLAIVELGGNDLLRGIAPASTRENLGAILDELARREIPVLLMGMRAPPNLGAQFQAEFDGLYPALAEEYGVALVPFFLEAVFDQPQLILPDRIHPTAEGVQALVEATGPAVVSALPPVR
jgi:acyl-CoA thioesterase I